MLPTPLNWDVLEYSLIFPTTYAVVTQLETYDSGQARTSVYVPNRDREVILRDYELPR